MNGRKYIRIALNADDALAFRESKQKAEEASGVALSDGAFALGVIRRQLYVEQELAPVANCSGNS